MPKNKRKDSAKEQMRELQALFNEWDPAGLLNLGAPSDEYECLVGPTLSRLSQGLSAGALASWLTAHIADHFGVPPGDAGPFAERAAEWYRSQR